MQIHIHVQQTQLQKLYGMRRYGKSLIEHLNDLGFLGKNVTCGHCVWVSEDDIRLLAENNTAVTHHASCNLRVRNGIAPVFAFLQAGVVVGIGMDDKELGDDKDFIEEMRLVSILHRLPSHHLNSSHLMPADCFKMGTQYGAAALGLSHLIGTLAKGKQADIVLLDMTRMTEPISHSNHNDIDLLLYRGRGLDVDTVLVGGEVVLEHGKPTRIDRTEVLNKLKVSIPDNYSERFDQENKSFQVLKDHIARFFNSWYTEMEEIAVEPFYFLNNKF